MEIGRDPIIQCYHNILIMIRYYCDTVLFSVFGQIVGFSPHLFHLQIIPSKLKLCQPLFHLINLSVASVLGHVQTGAARNKGVTKNGKVFAFVTAFLIFIMPVYTDSFWWAGGVRYH